MESLVAEISCGLSSRPNANISPAIPNPQALSTSTIPHCSRQQPTTAATSATTALLNADKSKNAAPPPTPMLPLPPSRPLFPSPLKFLWFGRDNPPKAPDNTFPKLTDSEDANDKDMVPAQPCTRFIETDMDVEPDHGPIAEHTDRTHASKTEVIGDVCNQIANMNMKSSIPQKHDVAAAESESTSDTSWISRILRLRLSRKVTDTSASRDTSTSRELIAESVLSIAEEVDQALLHCTEDFSEVFKDIAAHNECNNGDECTNSDVDDDDEVGLCMLETSQERVVHDRESISTFLHQVPLAEVQDISKLCLLSNLAYIIPQVQSKDLLNDHHLTFVTSSLVKKEEAEVHAALESAVMEANKRKKNGAKTGRKYLSAETSAASNKDSFVQVEVASDEYTSSSADMLSLDSHLRVEASQKGQDTMNAIKERPNSEGTQKEAGAEATLKVQSRCPCEWFICDDEASSTRYLVIQGSDSLASWQTNLSFDPTNFEGLLGVMVHRGVYEAAQGLYELVEKEMLNHVRKGSHARLCFTGHSLGGSLATLIAIMLVKRRVVEPTAVEGVVTLGAPCVLCTGELRLLQQLLLREQQFVNVVMHRDIVPRAFACHYPHQVARLLQRVNGTFRDHPCLNFQHVLYGPVGQVMILQPDDAQSPSHPLLPSTAGLFLIRLPLLHRQEEEQQQQQQDAAVKVREAQRAFFNMPHPLDVLRDPAAYGFEGAISRDHDPRSYKRALNSVLVHGLQRLRHLSRKTQPSLSTDYFHPLPSPLPPPPTSPSPSPLPNAKRHPLVPSQHIHMGLLFLLSITTDLFSSFISWA